MILEIESTFALDLALLFNEVLGPKQFETVDTSYLLNFEHYQLKLKTSNQSAINDKSLNKSLLKFQVEGTSKVIFSKLEFYLYKKSIIDSYKLLQNEKEVTLIDPEGKKWCFLTQ